MRSINAQKGIALFIAMLVLLMLTAVGSVLLSGSNLDLKMADAAAQRMVSDQLLEGAVEEILTAKGAARLFDSATSASVITAPSFKDDGVKASVNVIGETACKRTLNPNQVKGFACRYLDLRVASEFGRAKSGGGKWAENAIGAGVEQPLKVD